MVWPLESRRSCLCSKGGPLRDVPLKVLDQALQARGDSADSETLYRWLGIAKRTRWSVSDMNPHLNSVPRLARTAP